MYCNIRDNVLFNVLSLIIHRHTFYSTSQFINGDFSQLPFKYTVNFNFKLGRGPPNADVIRRGVAKC